jgi:hypothetical protein
LDLYLDKRGIDKLRTISKTVYYNIPPFLRFVFWPVEKVYWLLSILKLDSWIISGEEILSQQDLSIFYAGKKENKHFLIKLAFNTNYKDKYNGKIWIWKIAAIVKKMNIESIISITEAPLFICKIFGNRKSFSMPGWVYGELDISGDLSSFMNKRSYKSDKRKVRKYDLKSEVINEKTILHDWYYNMHVPFIKKVHGPAAIIIDYDQVKKKFKKCDLFFITQRHEKIAGGLIVVSKKRVNFWFLGIKDGNFDYVRDGAIGALYYLSILYYKEKGIKKIEMGPSRSFLDDGVLKYKKNRYMRIANTSKTYFLIKPLITTPGVKGFFLKNPMIVMNKKTLNGIIFADNDQLFNENYFDEIIREYYIKGLSKLHILVYGSVDENIRQTIPPEYSKIITINSIEN